MPKPITTPGRLMVEDALPEDLRGTLPVLDKRGVESVFRSLAEKHPERYVDTLHSLNNIASDAGYYYGGITSIGLDDFKLPPKAAAFRDKLRAQIREISQNPKLDAATRNQRIVELMSASTKAAREDLIDEAAEAGNGIAISAKHGFRGNPLQVSQIMFGDLLVADQKDRPIPIPGLHGYAEGVTPLEYFAGAYGSRKGYCLRKGTLVRMADLTVRKIEDIQPGEYVLGYDNGKCSPVKVNEVLAQGEKEIVRYTFRVGRMPKELRVIEATEDHKVLSCKKEGESSGRFRDPGVFSLSYARHAFGLVPSPGVRLFSKEKPYALLLGLLLGDGCLRGSGVTLTTADTSLIDNLNSIQTKCGGIWRDIPRNRKSGMPSYEYRLSDPRGSQLTGKHSLPEVRGWLKRMDIAGKYSWEKSIPKEALYWNEEDLADLIYGLFESDGGWRIGSRVSTLPCIGWAMTSRTLLEQLKTILELRFGIYGTELKTVKLAADSHVYGYTIHARHVCTVFKIWNRDSVMKFIDRIVKPYGNKGRSLLLYQKRIKPAVRDESLRFCFKSKERIGKYEAFDLSVENDSHLFVLANGMIVSNSSVQFGTQKAGFEGKQLRAVAHRVVVTGDDCGAKNVGISYPTTSPDILGRVLARSINGIPAGTVITKQNVDQLPEKVLIRSLATCRMPEGVCKLCAGHDENSRFPETGAYIGETAASAISEPLVQVALSSKHTGGAVGVTDKQIGGFEEINQFLQIPEHFRGAAAMSPEDGKVTSVVAAPQGGQYVFVNRTQVYVPPELKATAKPGDEVEAGDVLSTGTPNPETLVRHKGIGEGRRYFIDKFGEILKSNGIPAHMRNVDALSRAVFDRVRVTDPDGFMGHSVGDIMTYTDLQNEYVPRKGSASLPLNQLQGKWLEEPVLHYTIGTRITPKVISAMKAEGIAGAMVHGEPPQFDPEPMRLMDIAGTDPDWKTKMAGWNLQRNFLEAATHGADSPDTSTSYVGKVMDPTRLGNPK